MKLTREWVTPLVMGSFALLAVTGILMFFHADSGLNKLAHEWLSWMLVAAVLGHMLVNFGAVKRHFSATRTRVIAGIFVALLVASFMPLGGSGKPPFAAPVDALARAPLPVLAQVAGMSVDQARERLAAQGVTIDDAAPTLSAAVGGDLRREVRALNGLLASGMGH
ncbi:MAG TPA: hypothetical protein PLX20_14480 [Rhodocyclaceae bacterium]|nr:hypothetical protein [Rhodocyclaceae bacterium]HMZ84833.1 hypothetical protein [Rhodocyclaceae bacterium]HNA04274.1 hypothetical protein [Rhodocyclaceae bacterium]HNB79999.1 hypothetical protein [Rhodocyclaceae bacterium]HNC62652.1 hypothetical protein [Rhodocyclaceae bacterium]